MRSGGEPGIFRSRPDPIGARAESADSCLPRVALRLQQGTIEIDGFRAPERAGPGNRIRVCFVHRGPGF